MTVASPALGGPSRRGITTWGGDAYWPAVGEVPFQDSRGFELILRPDMSGASASFSHVGRTAVLRVSGTAKPSTPAISVGGGLHRDLGRWRLGLSGDVGIGAARQTERDAYQSGDPDFPTHHVSVYRFTGRWARASAQLEASHTWRSDPDDAGTSVGLLLRASALHGDFTVEHRIDFEAFTRETAHAEALPLYEPIAVFRTGLRHGFFLEAQGGYSFTVAPARTFLGREGMIGAVGIGKRF